MTKICPTCQQHFDESMVFCLNCGSVLKAKDKIINCEFEYKCPLQWSGLQKSENEDIRFCSSCEKNVYFAHSQSELDDLATAGKCVAFNQPNNNDIFNDFPLTTMGVIAPPPDFLPPPENIPTMGLPVMPERDNIKTEYDKKEELKKSWWEFWK